MGLQPGDILLNVNGASIGNMGDVRNEVMSNQPGDPVNVTIQRQGEQFTASSAFSTWPDTVPFEPIDHSWENMLTAQNELALSQLNLESANLQQAAQAVADQLGLHLDGSPAASVNSASAPGRRGPVGGDQGAWHFSYGMDSSLTHTETPTPGSGQTGPDRAHDQDSPHAALSGHGPAWRFAWTMSTQTQQTIP
jgi:hypothetical protein